MELMEKLDKKEELSNKEKLSQVQDFVEKTNQIWFDYWETNIKKDNTDLKIESIRWDWASSVKISLSKQWKEVFDYEMNADMFYKDKWEKRPVWVLMQIDWKTMSYNGDENNEKWEFKNHELLKKAESYKQEIEKLIFQNELGNLKKEIKEKSKEK